MKIIKFKVANSKKIHYYFQEGNRLYAADTNWTGSSFPLNGTWEEISKESAPKRIQKQFENICA